MTTIRILIDGRERFRQQVIDTERALEVIRKLLNTETGRVALISETDNVTRLWPLKAA